MFLLGRALRLPLRIVVGSSNLYTWAYDSHTTVELWLARERRWVIVDPTFSGYFSLGRSGRKLGAYDIHRLVSSGQSARVFWRAVRVPNAIRPSASGFDVREYFRNVGVLAATHDGAWGFVVTDARRALMPTNVFLTRSDPARAGATLRVEPRSRPPLPPMPRPRRVPLWAGSIPLEPKAATELPVRVNGPAFIVSSVPLVAAGLRTYATGDARFVSPVFVLTRARPAVTTFAPETRWAQISVYSAPRFPPSHDLLTP